MGSRNTADHRWESRWVLAAAITVAVTVVPIGCSIGVAFLIERHVRQPTTILGFAVWWLAMLGVCSSAFFIVSRVTRRALPLAVLLKLNMAFPGQAPKRLAAARRAGSVRDLGRRVDEARNRGVTDEPMLAAEHIVSLAASLNAHDRTTRGHAERVRALTDMIADEMRLSAARPRPAALVVLAPRHRQAHRAPPRAEQARGAVRRRVGRHPAPPARGGRITAPLSGWLGPWANTIAEHHERFDGGGYPFGLSGDGPSHLGPGSSRSRTPTTS